MTVTVRPVTPADAPELAELLNAIIARGGTTALEQPFTPERLDATYLTGPKVISCMVAVDDETGDWKVSRLWFAKRICPRAGATSGRSRASTASSAASVRRCSQQLATVPGNSA